MILAQHRYIDISLGTHGAGRNVDEMLRLVDALQFSEEHGEVCPAGWEKGDSGMKATTEGVAEYLAEIFDLTLRNSAKLKCVNLWIDLVSYPIRISMRVILRRHSTDS